MWCGRFQQDIDEEYKLAETFGPRKQNCVEIAVQQMLKQFNLWGFCVQIDIEVGENSKQQGVLALGKWPWDYPEYDTRMSTSREWEGTRKFHDLMWDMQKCYEDKVWQLYSEGEIGFTYRSKSERNSDELPEELQALRFSKVRNNGEEGISAHVLEATRHRGYHYKQEGLLYDLYVKHIFLPLYGGLHGSVANLNLKQDQEQET